MFGGSKGFAGLGASRPLDPASEIQRLLNQHTAHALALEKDIKEMKGKQEAAARKHAAALEEREKARSAFVAAERAVAQAEADAAHRRAEVESSQVANARLEAEVEELKRECADVTRQADDARAQFNGHVTELMDALQ
ncbi:hypothetical protein C2E21_7381 [Chlorella sorokiniana]|uniref:Uncharacterized protein n=1 Tax=Chlorella sorokiniana TaxID=3076 RepID=A0A2P6THY2_CHLSO|nr:hypothetical protein C2E21_7381 [Chlorella sorokiniana]|eukprot:PRW33902.1 hypothetical protein C2E21_7381 [Chlorella sorokiniana]